MKTGISMAAIMLSLNLQAATFNIPLKVKGIFGTQKARLTLKTSKGQFTRLQTTANSQMVLNALGGGDQVQLADDPQQVLGGKGEVYTLDEAKTVAIEFNDLGKTATIRVLNKGGKLFYCRPGQYLESIGCENSFPVSGDLVLKFHKVPGHKGHHIEKIKLGGGKKENWYLFGQLR